MPHRPGKIGKSWQLWGRRGPTRRTVPAAPTRSTAAVRITSPRRMDRTCKATPHLVTQSLVTDSMKWQEKCTDTEVLKQPSSYKQNSLITELTETFCLRIFDIGNFSSQKVLRLGTLALVEL
jgi:hypothetical protein